MWQLQEAKARFSAVVDAAVKDGPQIITRHGHEAVVVISKELYDQIKPQRKSLMDILKNAPKVNDFEVIRTTDSGRDINL